MKDNPTPSIGYTFGPYHADTVGLELRKSGIRIRLQPKPFQVLAVLLGRAGQTVSREELKKLLWAPDIFVDFDHGLNTAVNKIREALSDSAEEPRYVETLPNGYRFIGEISERFEQPSVATASRAPSLLPADGNPKRETGWRKRYLAVGVGLACLIAVVFLCFTSRGRYLEFRRRRSNRWLSYL
jgi:DNA-binding winged helix-turn-helix (wHTH) protein